MFRDCGVKDLFMIDAFAKGNGSFDFFLKEGYTVRAGSYLEWNSLAQVPRNSRGGE